MPADVLFLGEGPGKSEDLTGEAFVGKAGRLLDKIVADAIDKIITDYEAICMSVMGELVKHLSFYITNVVLCHPTDKRFGDNRKPTEGEIFACMGNVMEVYNRVKPKEVVFLGRVPEKYYKKEFPGGVYMYHPAFLERQGGQASPYYNTCVRTLEEVFRRIYAKD